MITNLSKARSTVNKWKKKIAEKQKDEDIKIISSKNKKNKKIRGST
jgi:abortive infection bacteriophage resistance protein